MTTEEAIKIFEAWAECKYRPTHDAAVLALSALRAQQERENPKQITNANRLMSMDDASKRDSLLNFFREWAGIGDSYIYDLTRIKTAFDVGTMSLDDFEEWDDGRITRLVDDFLGWLQQPAEEDDDE